MSSGSITPRRNYLPDNRRHVVNMSEDTVNTIQFRSQVRKPWEKEHENREIRSITDSVLPPKRDAEYTNVFMETYKDVLETPVYTLPFDMPDRLGVSSPYSVSSSSDAVDAVQASASALSTSTSRIPSSMASTSKPFNDYVGMQRSGGGTFRSIASRSGRNTVSVCDGRATLALTRAMEHQLDLSSLEKGLTKHLVTPRHALEQVPLRGSTVRMHSAVATSQLLDVVTPSHRKQHGKSKMQSALTHLVRPTTSSSANNTRPNTSSYMNSTTSSTLPIIPPLNLMPTYTSPFQGGVYTATARPTSKLVSSRVLNTTPFSFQAKEGEIHCALHLQQSQILRVAKLVHLPTPPYAVLPLRLNTMSLAPRSVVPSLRYATYQEDAASKKPSLDTLREQKQGIHPIDSKQQYETSARSQVAQCNSKYIESSDTSVKLCLTDYKTRAFACKRAGRSKGECVACFGIGLLLDNQCAYKEAYQWYCRARDLAVEQNDLPLLQCIYNCISVSQAHILGAEETALYYCELGNDLADQQQDNYSNFTHFTNAGLLLTALGKHEEATQKHLQALQCAVKSQDFLAQIAASGNVGFSCTRQDPTVETREQSSVTLGEYVRQLDELLANPTLYLGKLDAKNIAVVNGVMLATRAEAQCLLGTTLWELGERSKARVFMMACMDTATTVNELEIAGTARVALGMWKAQETQDRQK